MRIRSFFSLLVFAVLAWSFHPAVQADEHLTAEAVEVSTPVYQPDMASFQPQLGLYTYTVGWQGIPAASVSVAVEQEGAHYKFTVSAKTYSGIDVFYKMRYLAEAQISSLDFSPIRATFNQRENSRRKFTEIAFLENGDVHAFRKVKGQDPQVIQFHPANFMLDPFSAGFLALSLPWDPGQTREFDVFNGKSRYLVSLTAVDKIQMRVNDEVRDVWVVSPKVLNLTNPASNKKLRQAHIYVTADEKREVLQVVSSVFIGSVTTRLESFTPAGAASGIKIAQRRVQTFLE